MTLPIAITPELVSTLKRLKLGQILATLPERLALARTSKASHAEFLQLLLADEVSRRDMTSAARKAKTAGLDPQMLLANWDPTAAVTYDRHVLDELASLRFVDNTQNALIIGPVGVGKTFLATALGHTAIRRRRTVWLERSDQLFKRLRIARLDNSLDAEIRRLLRIDLLIIDDFALHTLDPSATNDFYDYADLGIMPISMSVVTEWAGQRGCRHDRGRHNQGVSSRVVFSTAERTKPWRSRRGFECGGRWGRTRWGSGRNSWPGATRIGPSKLSSG